MYIDHTVAAVTPMEIKVSIVEVPCRALRSALRWNGHAAHVTIGAANAVSTHCHPANLVSGTTANITDRSASGMNSTAAIAEAPEQAAGMIGIGVDVGRGTLDAGRGPIAGLLDDRAQLLDADVRGGFDSGDACGEVH